MNTLQENDMRLKTSTLLSAMNIYIMYNIDSDGSSMNWCLIAMNETV